MTQPMLEGLEAVRFGPRRKLSIKHPPTLEWVSHGCIECGTRMSFWWGGIPYRDTVASVCGDCWGLTFEEVHGPLRTVAGVKEGE